MLFGARTAFDEDDIETALDGLPTNAKYAWNYLRDQMWNKVKAKARRAPSMSCEFKPVDPDLKLFFESLEDSGLWVSIPNKDPDAATWYSPYFQSGETLTAFHQLPASVDKRGVKFAAGPLVVNECGDACVALPPWNVEFKPKKRDGIVIWYEFKMTFQLGVIPAHRGTSALLKLSDLAPAYYSNRWIFLPDYDSVEEHCQEHIKRVVVNHQPRPLAASMRAAITWKVDPDPHPRRHWVNRNCDEKDRDGQIWCEAKSIWVRFKDASHKTRVLKENQDHRSMRITEWENRRRLERKERNAEIRRHAETRALRRRKKRQRLGVVELEEGDNASDYSDKEEITESDNEWLAGEHRRAARGGWGD